MEEIELSIGIVKIKPLTNKVLNKALAKAVVVKNMTNNNVFLNYCERKMTQLWFWQWGSLTIEDGNKLREKIKDMLLKDGVISEQKPTADILSVAPKDQEWFNIQAERQKAIMSGGFPNGRGNNNSKQ